MESKNYSQEFLDLLNILDFTLDKCDAGFCVVDLQGANLGGIEQEVFNSAKEIVERMDIYVNDMLVEDLEEELELSSKGTWAAVVAEARQNDPFGKYATEISLLELASSDEMLSKVSLDECMAILEEESKRKEYF